MNSQPEHVLIIGAGPVGLTMACELARQGVRFRIVDQKTGPSVESKALGIHARTLEVFEDMGIIANFIDEGIKIHAANIFSRGDPIARLNLKDMPSHYNYVLALPQSQTEEILIQHLNSLGHNVEWNTQCTDISQKDNKVTATLKEADQESSITASYLIGSDGADSIVRKTCNLSFKGAKYEEHFALGDFHIEGPYPPNEACTFFNENGFIVLFPMKNSLYRAIANIDPKDSSTLDTEFFLKLMREREVPEPTLTYKPQWFSKFTIHKRIVPHYRTGNVFLAGDSAHIHSPIGGQGMNTGIQDAYNLAWKIAYVIKKLASPELLNSYNEEREPVGREVLDMTHKMTALVTTKNPILRKLRNLLFPVITNFNFIRERVSASLGEVDIHYRDSTLAKEYIHPELSSTAMNAFLSSPHPGDRAPDTLLTNAQTGHPHTLYQLLQGPQFKILLFLYSETDSHHLANASQIMNLRNRFSDQIAPPIFIGKKMIAETHDLPPTQTYLDQQQIVHSIYETNEPTLYLIRPDNYIAYRSIPVNIENLETYLNSFLVPS